MNLKQIKRLKMLLEQLSYEDLEDFYVKRIGSCRIICNQDLIDLFDYDITKVKGFNELNETDKNIVIAGIVKFINGGGLMYKHLKLVYKIEKKYVKNYGYRFKLYTIEGFSYLYYDLSIG